MSKEKLEKLSEITQELSELATLKEMENVLKNNMVEFDHKEKTYRVVKPTPGELRTIQEEKAKKYSQLAMVDEYMFEEQLKKVYKSKGIDLDELDKKILELEKKEQDYMLKLAKQESDKHVANVKNLVLEVRDTKNELFIKKVNYLQYSIENQVAEYANEMLLATVLAVKEGEEWKRVFVKHDSNEF